MTEMNVESRSDFLENLKKKYNVPTTYNAYVHLDSRIWLAVLNTVKKGIKSFYQGFTYDTVSINIDEDYEYIKGDFFIIIYDTFFQSHESEVILFTSDLKRFHKEFLYKKPIKIKRKIYPAGFYRPARGMFGWFLEEVPLGENGKPILNDDLFDVLKKEIDSFRKKRTIYQEMKLDYKRGILLMGDAGTGKTTFIKHLLNDLKTESIGIICNKNNYSELEFVLEIVSDSEYKNMLKILVMEDIDGMASEIRSTLLNFLDGVIPIDNTIIIATTNFPDRLDIAIKNRPSRFDSVHLFGKPNAISREKLLKIYFPNLDSHEMSKAVKESNGFSGAYFKEVYILSKLNDLTPVEAVKELKRRFSIFENYGENEEEE